MSILLNGDCLEELKDIDDNFVDLIFCDLPYGQTACKWDTLIDIDKLWIEFMRIKKLNTPIIFTCTTKFKFAKVLPSGCSKDTLSIFEFDAAITEAILPNIPFSFITNILRFTLNNRLGSGSHSTSTHLS